MISDIDVKWKLVMDEKEAEELCEALEKSKLDTILTRRIINDISHFLNNQGYYEE